VTSNSHLAFVSKSHHTRVNAEGCALILIVLVLAIGFVAAPRFQFLHELFVFRSVLHHRLILLGCELWQLADKRHYVPKQLIVMGVTPPRQACPSFSRRV
jgi:hypothetical protein